MIEITRNTLKREYNDIGLTKLSKKYKVSPGTMIKTLNEAKITLHGRGTRKGLRTKILVVRKRG